jgi:hypothetical protein
MQKIDALIIISGSLRLKKTAANSTDAIPLFFKNIRKYTITRARIKRARKITSIASLTAKQEKTP